jgi:hypothetical protein
MSKKNKTKEITRQEIETFRNPIGYDLDNLCYSNREPSCFNSVVSVRKYRVAAELIEEPIEVIQERIKKLFLESDNRHHYEPLMREAKKYGLELNYEDFGKLRKDKK